VEGGRGERRRAARWKRAGRSGGCGLSWAETEKRNENPFLFLFTIFQSIFKWKFEILFEFSNRAPNTTYYAAA
jgi:hypothetical protein